MSESCGTDDMACDGMALARLDSWQNHEGAQASAADKVTFGTNWLAQPEHGGFYQSVADGTYAACGLEVTIAQGGPQVNNRALLLAGKIEFHMGGNMLEAFSAVEQEHPGQGRRRVVPERAAGADDPPGTGAGHLGGPQERRTVSFSVTPASRAISSGW
jgi:hypothetical protein